MSFSSEEESQRSDSRKKKSTTTTNNNPSHFYAVPSPGVDIFKLEGEQYKNMGVVGAAILYDKSDGNFYLYFYQSNRQSLLQFALSYRFKYDIQENGGSYYGSFLDTQKQRWSIRFASKEISETFVMHLAFAIFSCGSRNEIFMLDLIQGSGDELRDGDSVGTRWVGYSVSYSGGFNVDQFKNNANEKNPQRYTLGAGNVIEAWDRGTVGMKKGSKRIVVTPSHLVQQGLEPNVPKDKELIFVIEIERTKRGNGPVSRNPAARSSHGPSELDDENASASTRGQVVKNLKMMANTGNSRTRVETIDDNDYETRNRSRGPDSNLYYQPNLMGIPGQPNLPTALPGMTNALVLHSNNYPAGPMVTPPYMNQPVIGPTGQPIYYPPASYPTPVIAPPVQPPAPAPAPAPAPSTVSLANPTAELIDLLVNERQYKQQINSKLDTVLAKVENLSDRTDNTFGKEPADNFMVASGISAKAVLQTIQSIVVDNDRMQKDVDEKATTLEKFNGQVNELLDRNQRIVDENNDLINERNRTIQEASNQYRKKLEELQNLKESLQIEVSQAASDLSRAGRRYENLKKQALAFQEEFNATKEELEREKSLRDKDKSDLENANAELNHLKQKYREDNKKMKEAIQEKDQAFIQYQVAKEQIDRVTKIIEDRTHQLSKDKASIEYSYIQERNSLAEQLETLNKELRNERIVATRRIQENQELFDNQLKQQIEDLRDKAVKELERRVGVAVQHALTNAAAQAEEEKQQALTDARVSFNEERERNNRILQETFNARLQDEIKIAYDKGRQLVLIETGKSTDAAFIQLRETEYETIRQALEKEIENQKRVINELNISIKTDPSKSGFTIDALSSVIKGIVNETFKTIIDNFSPDNGYTGEYVVNKVKEILVTTTLGGIPKEEPILEDEHEEEPPPQVIASRPPETYPAQVPVQQQTVPEKAPVKVQERVVQPESQPQPQPQSQPQPQAQPQPQPQSQPEPVVHVVPEVVAESVKVAVFTEPVKVSVSPSHPEVPPPEPVVTKPVIPIQEETIAKPEPEVKVTKDIPQPQPQPTQVQEKQPEEKADDWDDEFETPTPAVTQSTPSIITPGPPPVKATYFGPNFEEDDSDSDPLGLSTKKKQSRTTTTTSDSKATEPLPIGKGRKDEDFMSAIGNNSQKGDILGIFGTSVEKTTPIKSQKKNAFEEDDEVSEDFLFSKKDPLSNAGTKNNSTSTTANTTTKTKSQIDDIWGDSDVDFKF